MSRPPAPQPLPHPVVDNHCHLDHRVKGGERIEPADALARAASVGITRIVQVGTDVESSRWSVEAARTYPNVVAAVALHPNDAPRLGDDYKAAFAEIAELAADPHPTCPRCARIAAISCGRSAARSPKPTACSPARAACRPGWETTCTTPPAWR